ncbi:MAG: class I adenylate-forming enzyme family protein [Planctomycetota bacterium]
MTHLSGHLERTAQRLPEHPAATDLSSGATLTFRELREESDRVAAFLSEQGVEAGARIGLLAPNELAYLPAAFGILKVGGCSTPIPTHSTAAEVDEVLHEIEVEWVWVSPQAKGFDRCPVVATYRAPGDSSNGYTLHRTADFSARDAEFEAAFRETDPAFIRFTSGSTGARKGVVLSHAATTARVVAADERLQFSESDRVLWLLPLAYHFAVTITAYVRSGAHILLCPDSLPNKLAAAIAEHRPTVLYLSPVHVERLTSVATEEVFTSVRLIISTAAPIRREVIEAFEAKTGQTLGQAYGIIEAGLPCINLRTHGEPIDSVGRPTPTYELALFDDQGRRLPSDGDQPGEVGLRGPGLFSAYYRPWTLRAQDEHQGYFLTGDIAQRSPDGSITLVGRKKSMIFVGGLKFFPEEVEAVLNRLPEVAESLVRSEPHPKLGQVAHADLIVIDPTRFDLGHLRRHLATTLSSHKVPTHYHVVSTLPRTPSGKLRRH